MTFHVAIGLYIGNKEGPFLDVFDISVLAE